MVNIFNFPPKKGSSSDQDFLQEPCDLVQFDAVGRDVDVPPAKPETSAPAIASALDWSNQELASIYRVKRLLDAAGIPNHLERSLTDEGEPWCIFCTSQGEVFLHLSRIDGLYVLDSPNLAQPLFGRDFMALVEEFSHGALRDSDTAAKMRRKIVKLERGGKVLMHPAALLAALVFSIYVHSDDLVMFAPGEEDDSDLDAALAAVAAGLEPRDARDAEMETAFVGPVLASQNSAEAVISTAPDFQEVADAKIGPAYKDVSAKSGIALAPSAMAVGLSSIAIAYGFMSESYFEDEPAAATEANLEAARQLAHADLNKGQPDDQTRPSTSTLDIAALLDASLGEASLVEEEVLAANLDTAVTPVDLAALLDMALALPAAAEADALPATSETPATTDFEITTALAFAAVDGDAPLRVEASADDLPAAPSLAGDDLLLTMVFYSVDDLRLSLGDTLTEFSYGGTKISASFDLDDLTPELAVIIDNSLARDTGADALDDTPVLTISGLDQDPIEEQSSNGLIDRFLQEGSPSGDLEGDAISYVMYLMDRVGNGVESINLNDELLLIDSVAFAGNGFDDIFEMSWDLQDGGTVQAIGLKSDFVEFGLIA